jgi:hypothetical protein
MQAHDVPIDNSSRQSCLLRLTTLSLTALLLAVLPVTMAHAALSPSSDSASSIDLQMLSTSIATDSFANTYYVDTTHSNIYKMSSVGITTQINCCFGLPISSLSNPRGVALDGNGDLYIADTGNNRVVEINASSMASVINTRLYQLSRPSGIALDANGDLYIADTGNNRILEIAGGGQTAIVNTASYALSGPLSVSVDGQNTLYITDTGNNRIIAIPASGVPNALFAGQLSSPLSLTPGIDGTAYIAQTGNSVGSATARTGEAELPAVVATFSSTNINVSQSAGSEGTPATINVTLTPLGNFSNTLYLSVLGLPPNTEMQLSHPIVTLNATGAVTEALQVGTAQSGESSRLIPWSYHHNEFKHSRAVLFTAGIAPLSLLFVIGIGGAGKHFARAARTIGLVGVLLLVPAALISMTGCADGYPAGLFGNETYTATLVARTANGTAIYPLGSFGITLH